MASPVLVKWVLGPTVETRVGGIDFVAPVDSATAAFELCLTEALDILGGEHARVNTELDGEVLAVDAERIEAHRLEDVLTAHGGEAAVNVGAGEGVQVADVQALGRRAAHTALPVDAELIKRVPAAGTGGVRRQRLGGLDDALAISSADHDHMLAWSGAPCETPRAPDDI